MSHVVVLFVLLSALPMLTTSLQCYTCDSPITVNYTVTSDTVPKFTGCRLVDATKCILTVFWFQNPVHTTIKLNHVTTPISNESIHDAVFAIIEVQLSPDGKTPIVSHDLDFGCLSWETCNDEATLQRILHSLVIEDKLVPEFVPLLKMVEPFTNKSAAACHEYSNTTAGCPPPSIDTCQRCEIAIGKQTSSAKEICATCPRSAGNQNLVIREALFVLNNRTTFDRAQLTCQLPGCNSIYNGNEILRASNITFNFEEFFKNTPKNIL